MSFYDSVPYPTFVQEQTHPERMAIVSTIFGMAPAPLEACRVLEVGCGDGNNIIPLAYCWPHAKFAGIDLAEQPITRGQQAIADLGLQNISLEVRDLTALPADFGEFDYIIAHGIYAWVPEFVRDGLLALCRSHLAPQGVAFVSYNAMPAGHVRRVTRDLMLFHTRGIADAAEKVRQAAAILQFAAESTPRDDYFRQLMQERMKNILNSDTNALFHDDLSPYYEPVYFLEFLAHAAKHDLAYVAEADFFELSDSIFSPEVRLQLDALSKGDPIRKEQYMDFFSGRAFRQTLLCRKESAPERSTDAARIRAFYISTMMNPGEKEGEFVGPRGTKITTNHPVILKKLEELSELWPGSMSMEWMTGGDLLVEQFVLQLYAANLVKFHTHPPLFTLQPGEFPEASAVARYQASKGHAVATLTQYPAKIEGETARTFLQLLDGTRTREALAKEMARPLVAIDENLNSMAKLGLLKR